MAIVWRRRWADGKKKAASLAAAASSYAALCSVLAVQRSLLCGSEQRGRHWHSGGTGTPPPAEVNACICEAQTVSSIGPVAIARAEAICEQVVAACSAGRPRAT